MKKLIIICLLALTYTSTYAQEPTKQDAMDFIAKKMKQHLKPNFSSINFSDGIITIKGTNLFKDDEVFRDAIYLKNITNKYNVPTVTGPKVFYYYDFNMYDKSSTYKYANEVDLLQYADLYNEPGLMERLNKALDVIIKSNNYDPNSKF